MEVAEHRHLSGLGEPATEAGGSAADPRGQSVRGRERGQEPGQAPNPRTYTTHPPITTSPSLTHHTRPLPHSLSSGSSLAS